VDRNTQFIVNPVTGGWRKFLKEELHNLYSSENIMGVINLRRMTWAGHVTGMTSEGKKSLYRLTLRWENNIQIHFQVVVCIRVDQV
jgi:hypothetical protein